MSSRSAIHNELFRLYEHYVGEPDSAKDVYGYWLFIVGYLVGATGVVLYVTRFAASGGSRFEGVQISGITAAAGLTMCLFGIVLMLPVRRRGIQASVIGLLVSFVGITTFGVVYPENWYVGQPDWSPYVITIYTAGIATIAGVAALVPVLTGQKGMLVEEEGKTDDPPILTGDALEGAQFAVFRDEDGDWRWHVLHLEALAESESKAVTRPDAESMIERVKSKIGSAGLMELTTSAFRLYEGEDGTWEWTLVREDGSVVARCVDEFVERDDAEQSVSFLKDRGPTADVIEIEGAAFTYYEERDSWYWRLLDDDRTPLARSEDGHRSQERAEAAATTFAERFDGARLLDVDHVGVELREEGDAWTWRFVDEADDEFAESTREFDSRRDTEEAVEALLGELESASVTVAGEPTYEHYQSGREWRWRLIDENEHLVAESPSGVADAPEAERGTERFAAAARDADVVEIEDAAYETYPVDDEWHWRLVTEDRGVIAASTEPHADADEAAEAIDRVREQAREADLIEFENAAFQVYEGETGEWRWRLIDEDGNVLADSGEEHDSKGEAAQEMMTLKEQAPEAEVLEIETAAFELFVDDEDRWGWRLIDEGGKLVAEDPATHPDRGSARAAMNRVTDHLEADVRTMDRAIFQTYADAEEWHWRFVCTDGDVVARSADARPTRDELVGDLPDIREAAASAQGYTIGDVAVQLHGNGEWRWRLLDRDRDVIADSSVSYPDRETAMNAVAELKANVDEAPIFTIETAAIRLHGDDGWEWDLVDRDREVLATAAKPVDSKPRVVDAVDDVRRLSPTAGRVDFDVASFELFADETDRWRWRLIDDDGRTVATGSEGHDSSEAARRALGDVRDLIGDASILEIDGVSFELHASGEGWVWRLVDQHGVTMAESTQVYETRIDARDAMDAVKTHAPEGWITFTE